MSSSSPIGARWSLIVVPLFLFGCFGVGDDGGGGDESDDGDSTPGCRVDTDCRQGRVCLDLNGNRNDICEEGEECACGPAGSGNGGSSNGGTGGDTSGGSTTGGASDGGASDGGSTTGGNTTGGNATGGNTTGGNTTGGNATGGAGRGGSSTGGSSGAADCGAYCARVVGAMCTAPTEAACLAECDTLAEDCPAQAPAVLACVANPSNPITCMSGSPVITGCNAELDARDRCLICLPATGDGTCTTCAKGSCCDEAGDYGLASDGAAFYECANACTNQTCFDACIASYPIAGAALNALVECENTACPEECICEVVTGDDSCTTCYKNSCCAETVDYSVASDLAGFEACADLCNDTLCVDDCADEFPEAGAAFRTWSDCVSQECLAECS